MVNPVSLTGDLPIKYFSTSVRPRGEGPEGLLICLFWCLWRQSNDPVLDIEKSIERLFHKFLMSELESLLRIRVQLSWGLYCGLG